MMKRGKKMPKVKTYPEMNKKIVGLLRISSEPIDLYAAQLIEELQAGKDPGEAVWESTEFMKVYACSNCKARWGLYSIEDFDYCPTCGAKMRPDYRKNKGKADE